MIELENNERNLISVNADMSDMGIDFLEFRAKMLEAFAGWGFCYSPRPLVMETIMTMTIDDANIDKAVNENWVDDFVQFAKDTNTGLMVSYVPNINAFDNAVSYEIQDGNIVGELRMGWTRV